jgi:streptogramin lyase
MADRIGTEIASYRIEALIARGGMGEVYLATQSFPERKVALKLLPHDLASDQAFRERFIRESNAAASVEHPNIVPVYGAGDADGELYIAMRYVEGEDLRSLLDREGPLSPERAVHICSQIADALEEAHEHDLVHRDVKPGNILTSRGDRAYLTDFGLIRRSKLETDLTKTGQFMGTVDYVAPEQIKGDEVDGRADIYSLGCVLYECLTGEPPFRRDTEVATLYAHLEDPPPKPSVNRPELGDGLDRMIATAMAKQPSDRYSIAGEFARAARNALGSASGETLVRPGARRRILPAVGGLLLVLTAIALFVATRGGPTPERATHATAGPPLDSVVRLDPTTGKVAQTVSGLVVAVRDQSAVGFAAGEGGVWLGNRPNVEHIDPVTGTLRASIDVPSFFLNLAIGFRTVWVAGGAPNYLGRINPATDTLLRPVRVGASHGISKALLVAVSEGAVWVASGNQVLQVDPISNQVVRRINTGSADGIAADDRRVWVIDQLAGRLTEIDAASGTIVRSIDVPGRQDAITVGGGSVWLLDRVVGTVLQVDAETLATGDSVRVGSDETDITFGAGAVWLADGTGNSLTRIDAVTHVPTTFSIGSPVVRVAVDPDSGDVWGLIAQPE